MPRGKYDRKVSKIHRLEQELETHRKHEAKMSTEIEKLNAELRATKKAVEMAGKTIQIAAHPEEKFVALRENLVVLANARKALVDSDQIEPATVQAFDDEIQAHLKTLRSVRSDSYPTHSPHSIVPMQQQA
jgi:SMC interacting uncharacterized protein involved in chromosome segregation